MSDDVKPDPSTLESAAISSPEEDSTCASNTTVALEQGPCPVKPEAGAETSVPPSEDPYAYLQRDEFSSENYKLEVRGLPTYFGFKEIKKLFNNRLKLNVHKIKAGKGFLFITFINELYKLQALEKINGFKWKNRVLTAEVARPAQDPLVRKRVMDQVNKEVGGPVMENETIEETMTRVTTPWHSIPYADQLKKKMEAVDMFVCDMTRRILDVVKSTKIVAKICPIEQIKPSPVTEEYRNKCEFAIGPYQETKEMTVGFRVSSYKGGSVSVGPCSHLVHIPLSAKKIAEAFQEFVRASGIQAFDQETHGGCWKQLTVRITSTGEVMVIVLASERDMTPDRVCDVKESIKTLFSSMTEPTVKSLYWKQLEVHGQQEKHVPELLYGDAYITEKLLDLQFRISPDAFFQINLKAAEVLYSTIGSLLESNPRTTLLDVCCGTGTIGISLANKCGQVLGIELVQSAVEDAKMNAEINGLANKCEFFAGRAEQVLDVVLDRAKYENIVAIVDPPRSGLHQKVLLHLRRNDKIKQLIYVACDARLAMQNFVDLGRPISKTFKGTPFFPKLVIPVDMFPHCHHSETIILFEKKEAIEFGPEAEDRPQNEIPKYEYNDRSREHRGDRARQQYNDRIKRKGNNDKDNRNKRPRN